MGLFRALGGAALGVLLAPVTGGASLVAAAAGGALVAEAVGEMSDDEIEAKARAEGYSDGYDDSRVDSAKKLAEVLEKDDHLKKAVFALGICVANLDNDICEEERAEIQMMLGQPDSSLVSDKLKKEYDSIFKEKPDFRTVKSKYLKKVSVLHLQELDDFVQNVINADEVRTKEEEDFYNNEWLPYIRGKGVRV